VESGAYDVLNATELAGARAALLGVESTELIDLVYRLNVGCRVDAVSRSVFDAAGRLGWIEGSPLALTELGSLVADPIREYRLWLDRGRKLHAEGAHPLLAAHAYEGKSVLEPGSGFGCNLLSWSRVPGRFVGVEPVALYRQFTAIFAERERLPVPEVVDGRIESLPFRDAEFDFVVLYSVHQYVDIRAALREIARVLRPGGQLQILGPTLETVVGPICRDILAGRCARSKRHFKSAVNTLSYYALGRRVLVSRGAFATGAPIFPSSSTMRRWMAQIGLQYRRDASRRVLQEYCMIADKVSARS
jgi:SAM-dependent methyltransferase